MVLGGGGSGEPGDSSSAEGSGFATPSNRAPPARKPASLHPAWVQGGRDWIIYVECRSDGVVLYPAEKHFALAEATILLATLAQHYRLKLVPGHPVDPQALITLRARHGMKMFLTPRRP